MTANPIELIGGLTDATNVPKADIVGWAKARVPQILADLTELRNTVLASQLIVLVKVNGTLYRLDTTDTTTADDGITCIISTDGKRFKPISAVPTPTTISLGGVFSKAAVASRWLNSLGTDGTFTSTQPAASDLSNGTSGTGAVILGTLDTDGTLAANSDVRVATQKAVKTYVGAAFAANDAMIFRGVTDCSASPNYPAADRGDTYRVSVAGKIGGASGAVVEAGDIFICLTDGTVSGNQATVGAAWGIVQVNIDGAVTLTGSQTLTNKIITAPAITGGTAVALTGLGVRSTGAAFDLTIASSEVLTAGRTLSIVMGDAARTLTLGASPSVSGSNTGDQTITLTSDVTGSGVGSFATTIANNVVSLAKLATMATASFHGRTTAGTGNVEVLSATQATAILNGMVGDSGAGGTKGLVPAPAAGDTVAVKFLMANGTWAVPAGSGGGGAAAASQAEMEAASSTTVYASPGRTQFHPGVAKAWVNFNGTGTIAIRTNNNVSSITDNGVGDYTINFTTAFSSVDYGASVSAGRGAAGAGARMVLQGPWTAAPTVSAFRLVVADSTFAVADAEYVFGTFHGDQP